MKRVRYETVTSKESFALLIPSSVKEASGEATFAREYGAPVLVRAVSLEELRKMGAKIRGIDGELFWALLTLRGALEARDKLLLGKAEERLEKVYQKRESEHASRQSRKFDESRRKFGESIAPSVGLSPAESLKHWDGLRPGPKSKNDLYRLLSYEVSERVRLIQTALWWANGDFRPAIYCMDVETALYIHTFLIAPTGGKGFRICPYCTDQFFQDQPNQDYCCPPHREAHRVARWRHEQKQKVATENSKGRKNVTQKAR
jgi:hypothetical protein